MNVKDRQRLVLAALLHDIGKFWERADKKWDDSEIIKKYFPNKEFKHIVPTYEKSGAPMYGHALWTIAFFSEYKVGKFLDLDTGYGENIGNLSAKHHQPSNHLEAIISLADKWSSAIDRPDEGEDAVLGYNGVKQKWGEGFVKKVRLNSIFDCIYKAKIDNNHGFKLEPLDVLDTKNIFPSKIEIDKNADLSQEYKKLWDLFVSEFIQLEENNREFNSYILSLMHLLKKYTWCIPSATNLEPANVSLYEHLKTTAGIALSLYDYYFSNDITVDIVNRFVHDKLNHQDAIIMLCIDVSGIQKFIYDVASKRAAKSLKGRSFYLQLLIQNVVSDVLDHEMIRAYKCNVVYSSGGKAYILLPNIASVKKAINEIDEEYQNIMWNEFQGKILVNFGIVSFSYQTFKDENTGYWGSRVLSKDIENDKNISFSKEDRSFDLGDLWRIVSDRTSAKKVQKFKKMVLDFNNLFQPIAYDFEGEKCAATGIIKNKAQMIVLDSDESNDKPTYILKSVDNQIKLGSKLKRGNYLIAFKNAAGIDYDLEINRTKYKISNSESIVALPASKYESAEVYVLNNTNFVNKLNNTGMSTIFYGGNNQPINNDGEIKTFEDLCYVGESKQKAKLAILRMDIDNIGQIFINGFGDSSNSYITKKSFAAYSTLSSLLESFFSGYINQIREKDEFKNSVQILYSGGDDLFAIGRFDSVIDFAHTVQREFSKFTQREDITISGGIAIVGAKFPITKAAELAGKLEKKAKAFNNNSKNAINFFGETVSWDREFDFVKSTKELLCRFDGLITRSFIQNLQQYKIIKDAGSKSYKMDYSYVWHSAYSITRRLERIEKEKNPEVWNFMDRIRKNIIHNSEFGSERYLDLIAVGARWAEFIIKLK